VSTFQIVGVVVAALMAVVTATGLVRRRQQMRVRLVLSLIWLTAGAAILRPEVSMRLANAVGIGRGTDLLLYVAILVSIVVLFMIYLRFVALESQLTALVRHLAISEAPGSQASGQKSDRDTEDRGE
jgi:hypothetical protein